MFHPSLDVGHVTSMSVISVLSPSKLSLGTLNFAVYFGDDSLFNNISSKSSNPI